MHPLKKQISTLLKALEDNKLLKSVSYQDNFPDEPQIYTYSALVKASSVLSDGSPRIIDGHGTSLVTRESALLKCLAESIERLAQISYKDNQIKHSTFKNLRQNAINPTLLVNKESILKVSLGWTSGIDLFTNESYFIPAQTVYINYLNKSKEPALSDSNTTGAAAGFNREGTLVKAIYEVVERDAFMTSYLTGFPGKRIDIKPINNKTLKLAVEIAHRYNYELLVIDITNDLEIPTFLSVLVDRTGLGPAISLGAKSSFSRLDAIIGSVQESFSTGRWLRTEMIKTKGKIIINPKEINSIRDRGLYWYPTSMIKKLHYLSEQTENKINIQPFSLNSRQELELLKRKLKEKKIKVYIVDLSLDVFKNQGFKVYKAIIPQLQMLTLFESRKNIKHERLNAASNYFGYKNYSINKMPQPFL